MGRSFASAVVFELQLDELLFPMFRVYGVPPMLQVDQPEGILNVQGDPRPEESLLGQYSGQ